MLRIVTENVQKPCLLAICDNPRCGGYAKIDVEAAKVEDFHVVGFLKLLEDAGWGISLFGTVCPFHSGRQEKRLVDVYSGAGVLIN